MNYKDKFLENKDAVFLNLPIDEELISRTEKTLNCIFLNELKDLYKTSNGIEFGDFIVFPIFDSSTNKSKKKTWNSLQRNNDPELSECFYGAPEVFDNFIVIATDGNNYYLQSRHDGGAHVWYWEEGSEEIVELDYSLWEWLNEAFDQEIQYGHI